MATPTLSLAAAAMCGAHKHTGRVVMDSADGHKHYLLALCTLDAGHQGDHDDQDNSVTWSQERRAG